MRRRIIIGESGGPTPVIDWEVAGALDATQRRGWEVYGMRNGLAGVLNANIAGNIVELTGVDPMSFAFNGPGAGLGTIRMDPEPAQLEVMARNLKLLGVDGVIYIGGNDSAAHLLALSAHSEVATIHAIKTVDNDLPETHHCPGYGSAALFNATALKNAHSDYGSYAMRANFIVEGQVVEGCDLAPVLLYQVMGRKTGWLAQATGFAKVDPRGQIDPDRPPHLVLCFEFPFSETEFLGEVDRVITRLGQCVIAVQEDLMDGNAGQTLKELHGGEIREDPKGHYMHGTPASFSPAVYLAGLIKEKLKARCVHGEIKDTGLVPQHIQRSYMMSPVDAAEAYRVGFACVEALENGLTERSVVLRKDGGKMVTDVTALSTIADKERPVPEEYIRGLDGPTQTFVDEFIYLIGGPAAIPHYSRGAFKCVAVPEEIRAQPYISKTKAQRDAEKEEKSDQQA